MRGTGLLMSLSALALALPLPAAAQQTPPPVEPAPLEDVVPSGVTPPPVTMRIQVASGGVWQPWYPGDDQRRLSPWVSLSRTRSGTPFAFGAPDDGPNLTFLRRGTTEFAVAVRREGRRRDGDLYPNLPGIGRTIEVGGAVETWASDTLRLRGDVRKGLNGHRGWISQLGADYVRRNGDQWLVAVGPRVLLGDARYQRAWFGVDDRAAAATGLNVYRPRGGVRSVAATGSWSFEVSKHWGLEGQLTYERLVGDAYRSPIMQDWNSRNQVQVAIGLHYTFSVKVPDRGIWRIIR